MGESGNDTIVCGKGDDYAEGLGENDQLFGRSGIDVLYGGFGASA